MQTYSVLMAVYIKESPDHFDNSIQSMLNQTVVSDDIVIVCDGPLTKELNGVIDKNTKKHPNLFTIVRLPENQGLGIALNEGMKYCKNDIIARMDADDISLPDRCEKQLFVMQNQTIDIVSGWIKEFESNPQNSSFIRKVPENQHTIVSWAKKRNPFNHPCVMYRKQSVLKAGGYKDFHLFEDYYLWMRMLNCGAKGFNLQSILLYMRVDSNMYLRRGGIHYAISLFSFRKWMYKNKMLKYWEYKYIAYAHCIVALFPSKLRRFIYKTFLRE